MRESPFSIATRRANLERLARGVWDLVVIGGGITGSGIARDAALRGWRVALVEREDFASGTSGRTGRMIHGGFRYLESGQFGFVAESLAERAVLRRTAPNLVRPHPFLIPVHGSPIRLAVMAAGLLLYQGLARGQTAGPARLLSGSRTRSAEPLVSTDRLTGGALYWDCLADDARLVLAVVLDAHRRGAVVVNHAPAVDFPKVGGRIAAVAVRDALSGRTCEVRARVVMNAAGPWLDRVAASAGHRVRILRLTKGSHLVVPRSRLNTERAIIFSSPRDRRHLYLVPWERHAILGTTETDHEGDLDGVHADFEDMAYLLEAARAAFPSSALQPEDVVSTFAALRPLVDRPGVSAYRVPRDYRIVESPSGLISVAGGKLTTFRRMAQEAVDLAARRLGGVAGQRRCVTTAQPIEPPGGAEDLEPGDDRQRYFLITYGRRSQEVLALARGDLSAPLIEGLPYLKAQIVHAARCEMAVTLCDCLIRRLHLIHETPDQGLGAAEPAARLLAPLLGWTEAEVAVQVERYRAEVAQTRRYRELPAP